MYLADLLSRNYLNETYEHEIDIDGVVHSVVRYDSSFNKLYDIKKATQEDEVLQKVHDYCIQGWPDPKFIDAKIKFYYNARNDICCDNGIIYFNNRIVIPLSLRKTMLELLHESHIGITKTKLRANNILYWPGMGNEIEQFILKCKICEKFRSRNRKEPLLPYIVPKLPFEKIAVDIATYQNDNYLILMDYYSKWLEICKLRNKTAREIILTLKNIFAIHGIPKIVYSDNMPFDSYEFRCFADLWNFKIITSSPMYARSNGEAEKAVHIAKQMLKKKSDEGKDINISLLEYRCTAIPHLNASPSELLMSRLLRTKIPIVDYKLKPKIQNNNVHKLKVSQQKYKTYHDIRASRAVINYKKGQSIVIRKNNIWVPGEVICKANAPRSYIVKDNCGSVVRRNSSYLRPSFNKPIICNSNIEDNVTNISGNNIQCNNDNVTNISDNNIQCNNENVTNISNNENVTNISNNENVTNQNYVTRSGRIVKQPERFVTL